MTTAVDEQLVEPGEASAELLRILASPDFVSSKQLTSFLRYVVTEALAGRSANLKERTVAHNALGRAVRFDPRLDCVVRVVAGKLRRSLARYYTAEGAADPVFIDMPKGSYCPVFRRRPEREAGNAGDSAWAAGDAGKPRRSSQRMVAVAPFKLLTDGSKERLLAAILTDDLIVRRGRLSGLEVIDCLATGFSRNSREDLRAGATRLHADFVFWGTVGRIGACLRLTARLIDGHNGVLAWGDQYDRKLNQVPLAQQDDVADLIVSGIGRYFRIA